MYVGLTIILYRQLRRTGTSIVCITGLNKSWTYVVRVLTDNDHSYILQRAQT